MPSCVRRSTRSCNQRLASLPGRARCRARTPTSLRPRRQPHRHCHQRDMRGAVPRGRAHSLGPRATLRRRRRDARGADPLRCMLSLPRSERHNSSTWAARTSAAESPLCVSYISAFRTSRSLSFAGPSIGLPRRTASSVRTACSRHVLRCAMLSRTVQRPSSAGGKSSHNVKERGLLDARSLERLHQAFSQRVVSHAGSITASAGATLHGPAIST